MLAIVGVGGTFLLGLIFIAVVTYDAKSQEIRGENLRLLEQNRKLRAFLNQVACDSLGNPALEAQLLSQELDRTELGK